MRHTRRAFLAATAGIAAAVGGCSGSDDNGTNSAPAKKVDMAAELKKPATLTFWTWVPKIENQVKLFEQKYPNIKVKAVTVGQGPPHYQKLRTALKSGEGAPDVAQIEFQYIPSFTVTNSLLDLSPYVPSNFKSHYADWVASQVSSGGKIWAVPQDTGPMGMLYRTDLFDKAGIEPPKAWQEFAEAARTYHEKNPGRYLTNMASNDVGAWLGLFWQAGSRPFHLASEDSLTVNLADPSAKKVTDFWTPLVQEGSISTDPGNTDQYFQSLARGKYAALLVAAWGPVFLEGTAGNTAGKWRAVPLPQWDEAKPASGNFGGSTDAVLATTKHPAAAAELARFINQDKGPALRLATEQFLFPATNEILEDPAWVEQKSKFYGGQQVNKVFSEINETVLKDWQWSPIHDFVASSGNETFGGAMTRKADLTPALQEWQDTIVEYAKRQGFKVDE